MDAWANEHGWTPQTRAQKRFGYRPALDGVRGLAVLVVLLYHSGKLATDPVGALSGGFLGVDLFFVLSGFLITSLLLVEWTNDRTIRFGAFWARRARRLLPALVLVVAAVAVTYCLRGALDLSDSTTIRFRGEALSSLFYAANWNAIVSGTSYFDQFGGPSLLQHMWSLAIEEQFYLVWPVVVFVGLRVLHIGRTTFLGLIGGGVLLSATLMAVLFQPGEDPSRVYYGTDTRAQAILVGAFLAFVIIDLPRERLRHTAVQAAGWVGLLGLAVIVLSVGDDASVDSWMYRGGFLLVAILGSLLVLGAAGPSATPLGRTLSWSPLVFVGTISYGLYLWHWPVFVVLDSSRTGLRGITLLAVRLAATFGLALASYYFVERPIRYPSRSRRRQQFALIGIAEVAAVAILVGLVTVPTSSSAVFAAPAPLGEARTGGPAPEVAPGDIKVTVAGDSFATSLVSQRKVGSAPRLRVDDVSLLGCGFVAGQRIVKKPVDAPRWCDTRQQRWADSVASWDPSVTILMPGVWEVFDRYLAGHRVPVGSAEFDGMLTDALDEARGIFTASGGRMVLTTLPCFHALKPGSDFDRPEVDDPTRIGAVNDVLRQFASEHPEDTGLLDLHGFLCPDGEFTGTVDGVTYTDDGIHLNVDGAEAVWGWLASEVPSVAR